MLYMQVDSKWVTWVWVPRSPKQKWHRYEGVHNRIASCWSCNKLSLETSAIPSLLASRKGDEVSCVCWPAEFRLPVFMYCIVTEEWIHWQARQGQCYTPEPSNHNGRHWRACTNAGFPDGTAWEGGGRLPPLLCNGEQTLSIFLLRLQPARGHLSRLHPFYSYKGLAIPQTKWQ